MSSLADFPSAVSRVHQLEKLSQAIRNHKGRTQAFEALHSGDRVTILGKLKIAYFDWTTIEKKQLKPRIKRVILELSKKIVSSQSIKIPTRSLETFSPQKTPIDRLPDVLLHAIFENAAMDLTTTALVCKKFHHAQKTFYKTIFTTYLRDKYLMTFHKDVALKPHESLSPEAACASVKKIYLRATRRLRIQKKIHPLLLSRSVAKQRQLIKDNDLLTLYYHLLFTYFLNVTLPDLSNTEDPSIKAEVVRKWMKEHRNDVLSEITNLQLNNCKLQTLPSEVLFFANLEILNLENNQIRKLLKGLVHLSHLSLIKLSNNQLTDLPKEFKNLSRLTLDGFEKNPLTFKSALFGALLCYTSFKKMDNATRSIHFSTLESLFARLTKKKDGALLQDRFTALLKTIRNKDCRRTLEYCLLLSYTSILDKAWHAIDHPQMLHYFEQLPQSIRHRIYAFTYFLEKKAGTKISHRDFGRNAFRNSDYPLSDPSIRSKAIQLAYLEELYIKQIKNQHNCNLSRSLTLFLKEFDISFKSTINKHFHDSLKKKGVFPSQIPTHILNNARLEAIEHLIKKITS